ncbi:DUF3025 domain-containing protein [Chitinimonas naiadis]
MPDWPLPYLQQSPWFQALQPTLQQLGWQRFPDEAAWADLPGKLRPQTESGLAVRFCAPPPDELGYEARIAHTGLVATRPDNWHDALNALCWLSWPRSKAALNALHLRELANQTSRQRSRRRDLATLFDESGLVLACADPSLVTALVTHDWTTLFVERAAAWGQLIQPFSFGHALLEKGLSPFIGIVAKIMVLEVEPDWFRQDPETRLAELDQRVAALINSGEQPEHGQLWPLPVLGIPGWWPQQHAAFYADQTHFRPRRGVIHPG